MTQEFNAEAEKVQKKKANITVEENDNGGVALKPNGRRRESSVIFDRGS